MAATSNAEDLQLVDSHTSKLLLETSMPSSASPYPSPSSAFYPPPIPASHEFANKLAANRRYRGAAGNINLHTGGVGGLSSVGGQASASATDSYLSATSATASRRASDAFLAYSSSPSRNNSDLKGAVSAPGSRRTSRDVSINGKGHPEPASLDQSSTNSSNTVEIPQSGNSGLDSLVPAGNKAGDITPSAINQDVFTGQDAAPNHRQPPEDVLSPNSVLSDSTVTPSSTTIKRFSITSLTSTRPAPPSPAPSRRPSLQRKASSSRRSTHSTGSRDAAHLSTTPSEKAAGFAGDRSSRRQSTLSMSFSWLAAEGGTTEEKEEDVPLPKATARISQNVEEAQKLDPDSSNGQDEGYISKPIIVRDFAYLEDDERFSNRPNELLPRSERPQALGEPHDQDEGEGGWEEEEDDRNDWHTQWQYHDPEDGEGDLTPLPNTSQLEESGGGTGGWIDPDLPLQPGIYRAMYAFEAEGTAEMTLEEGQLVKVVGRGGGVGWAVVERDWTPGKGDNVAESRDSSSEDKIDASGSGALALAGQALVPEGYLEPYQLGDPRDLN
ncbi:hypothetical protein FRC16_010469 [Serendipita sp. 398]|nr:hypothetical protein FRC16_010469 [Serendipita sp. 398]